MAAARQDAWNQEEDLILAEVVLRHVREGSTQLAAFQEVGERLSRTAAACGFRWNSFIRKKYQSAIALAKKQRKQFKQKQPKQPREEDVIEEPMLSLEDVIGYLEKLRSQEQNHEKLMHENERMALEVEALKEKNAKLEHELKETRKENRSIQEDYKALIAIMDRARKLAVVGGENDETANHGKGLQKSNK